MPIRWKEFSGIGTVILSGLGGFAGCSSNADPSPEVLPTSSLGDAGAPSDPGPRSPNGVEAGRGYPSDGGVLRPDRFVTKVISFTPGACAGFGATAMPGIVMGPPQGGGANHGSTDVVSLGTDGEIVVSFEPNAIVDGDGPDFIVFENPFYVGGDPTRVYAEPGEVSVSDDGSTWVTFPCTATSYPYGSCAGWHVVVSNPQNGISPTDPAVAGGDPFDLADIGVKHVRYVRIRDKAHEPCTSPSVTTNGFDLDAIAIVRAEVP
jgi:hypothetical protein